MNRRVFILALSFATLFAAITYAVNPPTPFRPSDNIQDPNCLPTDSNCYVTYGLTTQANGTDLYTDTKTINFGSGLTVTDNLNGVVTVEAGGGDFVQINTGNASIYSGVLGSPSASPDSIFLGSGAGSGVAEAVSSAIFMGKNAGVNATFAFDSNFFGWGAGSGATNAFRSNFMGLFAGYEAINALNSNFFGPGSGQEASNALQSNFLGAGAGFQATNAFNSNFLGYYTGRQASNANDSNFFGYEAGYQATNAANSIFIGTGAGLLASVNNTAFYDESLTFANTSIAIGHRATPASFSNSIALGAYATNTATNQLMLGSTTRRIDTLVFNGGTGNTCAVNASTGISCSSDERLKTNILDLDETTLSKVLSLRTVSYNWNTDPSGITMVGFIAQDLQDKFPELVTENTDGMLAVNYAQMTPILTKALQEMNLNIVGIADLERENTWRESLVGWFASASNGISRFFAGEVRTDKLCVGETCVTEAQLQQLLNQQQIPASPSVPDPVPAQDDPEDEIPPVDENPEPGDEAQEEPQVEVDESPEVSEEGAPDEGVGEHETE